MTTSDDNIVLLDSDGNIVQPRVSRGRPPGHVPRNKKRTEQDDIDEYERDLPGKSRDLSKTTTVHGSWLLSRDSVRRLEQLKFDPILRMVQQYERLEEDIYNLTHNPDGTYKEKFSHLAYSSMALIQQKITNDLIRYGYARVTETTNVNNNNVGPLMIQLTDASVSDKVDNDVSTEES